MAKKKVLIIAYYWPPSGGGGVQRWVKFVKYLGNFDWEPIVYVPENPDYPVLDKSLAKDVPDDVEILKKKIWEPYAYYSALLGRKKEDKANLGLLSSNKTKKSRIKNLLIWVRGNLFIPDARKFWIRPSIRFLTKYLGNNPVDVIITTGPPHSMHIIGLGLKRKLGVPWLADFRDPWLHMDNNIKDLMYSSRTYRKHEKLEKAVLTEADRVVTVTPQIIKDYNPIRQSKIDLVTNGFDTDDFKTVPAATGKFIIGHYGTMGKYRNPLVLLEVLKEMCQKDKDFRSELVLELIGPVDSSILNAVQENGLNSNLLCVDYLPHTESINRMANASILLLLLDKNVTMKGRMTGKIFEYLATQRTILGLGMPDCDPAELLKETNGGVMLDYTNYPEIKKFITKEFELFKLGENKRENDAKINKYSRYELTRALSHIMNEMVS